MFKLEDLKIRRKAWVKAANINPNRLGWLLDDCTVLNPIDRKKIDVWMDALEKGEVVRAVGNSRCGKGLLLWGEPGHGKTTIALSIIQEVMTRFPIESFDVKEGRVLIIDDLGKEHASLSGWQRSMFHHVLRTRFNNGLPTIVTTNIELENWGSMYGDATESFAHESFIYLPIETSDLRK